MIRLNLLSNQIGKSKNILIQIKGSIGLIILFSPSNLNTFTTESIKQIISALLQLQQNPQIKVIVILSNIPKAFSAGGDLKQFNKQKSYQTWLRNDFFINFHNTFKLLKKPIIAGINGWAFGGGLEVALLCDIVIISQTSKIGLPQINLGLTTGMGGTQNLSNLIGKNLTMKYFLTGQPLNLSQINKRGTVQIIPSQNFNQKILSLANKIAQKPLDSLITAKRAVNMSVQLPLYQGQMFQRSIFYPLLSTEGAKQGIKAFVQKRKANFK